MKKKYPIKILGGLILGGIYPDIPPRRYAPGTPLSLVEIWPIISHNLETVQGRR